MSDRGYRDYFNVLGVSRDANSKEIKQAFRKLAREYHPDVNSDDDSAEEKFKEVSEAYEVLSDPEKRRRYEQFGEYWNQTSGMPGFDVDFGRYGNFDEFINELLGRFGGSQRQTGFRGGGSGAEDYFGTHGRASIKLDAEVKVKIRFDEAFRGTERTLSVNGEKVQVRVPKGVKTGSKLRLKGKGNHQPGTGRRGDLYLNLQVQSHPVWRIDGDHIRAELPVSFQELVLGGNVKLIIPDGEAELVIPPGTSLEKIFRLKGKGWPSNGGRGDLLLSLSLQIPSNWTKEEFVLLEKLKLLQNEDLRKHWLASAEL